MEEKTLKWKVGSPEVLDQMMFPDDDKDIKPSDLVHGEERKQLRFGGEDE